MAWNKSKKHSQTKELIKENSLNAKDNQQIQKVQPDLAKFWFVIAYKLVIIFLSFP